MKKSKNTISAGRIRVRIAALAVVMMMVFAGAGIVSAAGTKDKDTAKLTKVEKMAQNQLKKLKATGRDSMKNLKKAFLWSASLKFRDISPAKRGKAAASYYGIDGFSKGSGDCNTAAFTFYWMAKMLGYEARVIQGYVPDTSMTDLKTHAWVMIKIGKKEYFFDPDLNRAYQKYLGQQVKTSRGMVKITKYHGFKFLFGQKGTYIYHDENKKLMGKMPK